MISCGKILKIIATRYNILRLKCTEFNFGWGSIPTDLVGGVWVSYIQCSPDPLAGFGVLLLREWERKDVEGMGMGGREGKENPGYVRPCANNHAHNCHRELLFECQR